MPRLPRSPAAFNRSLGLRLAAIKPSRSSQQADTASSAGVRHRGARESHPPLAGPSAAGDAQLIRCHNRQIPGGAQCIERIVGSGGYFQIRRRIGPPKFHKEMTQQAQPLLSIWSRRKLSRTQRLSRMIDFFSTSEIVSLLSKIILLG